MQFEEIIFLLFGYFIFVEFIFERGECVDELDLDYVDVLVLDYLFVEKRVVEVLVGVLEFVVFGIFFVCVQVIVDCVGVVIFDDVDELFCIWVS